MPNPKENQAEEIRRVACQIATEDGGTIAIGNLYEKVLARLKNVINICLMYLF